MELWQEWWVWVAAGAVLGVLEVIVSGYVLLGFAAGAIVTGLLIWVGLLGQSVGGVLLAFAIASFAAWASFHWLFRLPLDRAKVIHHDINDN